MYICVSINVCMYLLTILSTSPLGQKRLKFWAKTFSRWVVTYLAVRHQGCLLSMPLLLPCKLLGSETIVFNSAFYFGSPRCKPQSMALTNHIVKILGRHASVLSMCRPFSLLFSKQDSVRAVVTGFTLYGAQWVTQGQLQIYHGMYSGIYIHVYVCNKIHLFKPVRGLVFERLLT